MAGASGKSYIHQPNGRWLECAGGYGGFVDHSTNPYAKKQWTPPRQPPVPGDPYTQTRPLTKEFSCRPLHEEPLTNCSHCPKGNADPSQYKCLGKGWNGIPPGEFSPVRSLLRPPAPLERPEPGKKLGKFDRQQPGSSGALLAAREMAKPKEVSKRNKPVIGDLRCIHIGRPGNIQTTSADRVIYAASQMPDPALIVAAMSPPYRGQLQQASRSKCRRIRELEWFL